MNPLDEREARLATRAAVVAGAAFVALYATTAFSDSAYVLGASIGLGMALLLWLAARSGRRTLAALAALAVGFGPWGAAWVLGAPFLLLSGWLLTRPRSRARPQIEPGETPDGETPDGEAPMVGRRRRRQAAVTPVDVGRRRPTANKRYTPPSGR